MSARALRFEGRLSAHQQAILAQRTTRAAADDSRAGDVAALIADVRARGDEALFEQVRALDGVALAALEVPRARWEAALASLEPRLRAALERMVRNLQAAHEVQRPREVVTDVEPGVTVGRRPDALARVGIYAPGGRAVYPSSLLMCAIPARVAGVAEVVVCSPVQPDGEPSPLVLAAAALAGVQRVFAVGGAGAIAAMAHGTASVPAVDRIVGPGNAWVAEAKRQVAGLVPIDAPAGPSEVLVIADDSAPPEAVARELVAQAEHDPDAWALAVLIGGDPARVRAALAAEAAAAPRAEVVHQALAARGGVLAAASRDEALAFATAFAAEHLWLALADASEALGRVRGSGAVFVGAPSSVAFGDYLTGGNHVLPTGGAARAWSGLSVLDFVRWTSWQRVTPAAAAALAADTAWLARAEGLPGHAAAAAAWEAGA